MEGFVDIFPAANMILVLLAIYFIVLISVGIKFSGNIDESEDLILAGRGLTLPFMFSSVVATWVGSATILGASAEAFASGLQGVIFDPFGCVLTMLLMGLFVAHKLRRARYLTTTDFFTRRYGDIAARPFVFFQFLGHWAWIAGQLVALGILIKMTTGFSFELAIIIGTIAITLLTYLGGLWALSRTDALALILIIAGLVVVVPSALGSVGGWDSFIANAGNWNELPPFSILPAGLGPDDIGYMWYTGLMGLSYYIAAWAALGLADPSSVTLGMRALAAKDEKTATAGFLLGGASYLLIGLIPVFVGMVVFQVNPDFPIESYTDVFPWFVANFCKPWIGALMVIALVAAIASTAGGNILACSTMIVNNVYLAKKPEATQKQQLRALRIGIFIVVMTALGLGLFAQTVYQLAVFGGAIMLPSVATAFWFGWFWKKANTRGAIASIIAGIGSWIVIFLLIKPITTLANTIDLGGGEVLFMSEWAMWDAVYIAITPATLISVITMIVVSLATQKSCPPKPIADADGNEFTTGLFYWSKKNKQTA